MKGRSTGIGLPDREAVEGNVMQGQSEKATAPLAAQAGALEVFKGSWVWISTYADDRLISRSGGIVAGVLVQEEVDVIVVSLGAGDELAEFHLLGARDQVIASAYDDGVIFERGRRRIDVSA
jgi:hypothetical protein